MRLEIEKMSKKQLLEKLRLLQAPMPAASAVNSFSKINTNIQKNQLEFEIQNRELRETQQKLEEARNRFADLYDLAPVTYASFDENGAVININLTGVTMLGCDRIKVIDTPFSRWLVKNDVGKFFSHIRAVLQSDTHKYGEIQIQGKNSKIYDLRMDSIRSKDVVTGKYLCRSILFDITEDNKIRRETTLQTRQLKLISDSLPALIAYINNAEQHIFINKTYASWFSTSADQIIGKSIREIWGEQAYSNVNRFITNCFSGEQRSFDMELDSSDGKKKHINTILIPDVSDDNFVCGIIVLMGDVTDKLASEMIDRKRLLESVHFSRLCTMGEMASEIAHELNQPLAAISIYSDACRRIILSGKARRNDLMQSLNDIGEQAERAGEVIRRIREFTSKKELKFTLTSINNIVREALHLITIELKAHNVELRLDFGSGLPDIMADRILIEQVILNLSRNAIDAMEEIDMTKRFLTIQTVALKTKEVEVNIIDAGPGLTGGQLKKIFEPFHTTKKTGMGMGLTICQTIIAAHHGRLWAARNEFYGTTFSFTLPLFTEGEYNAI